ncbi:MAG: translation initiation factor IF-3 [Anaerolineales bacterium]
MSTSNYRVNQEIRAPQVRLINVDGENIGVVSIQDALQAAYDADLDLIEIAPQADPPVCRVMDYGKFMYERTKKEKEAKKAQKVIEIKEIRMRPKTTDHHKSFKVRDARRWLEEGKKVRVRVRFRGRERDYPEIAIQDLNEIAEELADVSVIEQRPSFEGRTMLMILAPNTGKK